MDTLLILLGLLLILAGYVWLVMQAFGRSLFWGLASLVPPLALVFMLRHWMQARSSVMLGGLGCIPLVVGLTLLAVHDSARLEAILRFGRIGLWFLAICVAVVVLATVFNTVRLQAMTQREEIAVARLVGATESFVRRPFLYLGALTGMAAALLAILTAGLALQPLNGAVLGLAHSYGAEFALHLPSLPVLAVEVLAAGILGALSARWSVTRSTRF